MRLFPLVLRLSSLILRVDLSLPQLLQRATASGARGRALHSSETSLGLVVLRISIERWAGRLYPLDIRIRSETLRSAYAPQVRTAEIPVRAVADVRIRAELFQLEILGRGGFSDDQTLTHVEISQIVKVGRSLTGEAPRHQFRLIDIVLRRRLILIVVLVVVVSIIRLVSFQIRFCRRVHLNLIVIGG